MKIGRSKIITAVIILATVVLAGVTSYSAYKLFSTKDVAVAPTVPSPSYAFTCQEYQLLVDTDGIVRIKNGGTETQPTRDIDLLINGEVVGNFSVPALTPEEDAILGNINLPTGDFNWSIGGDVNCQGGSGRTHETQLCSTVSFAVSADEPSSPTATPTESVAPTTTPTSAPTTTPTSAPTTTPTSAPTNTPTPTTTQSIGGSDPTSTPTSTKTLTPTKIAAGSETLTPTKIAAGSETSTTEELPEAGINYPTIVLIFLSVLLVTGGLLLAL